MNEQPLPTDWPNVLGMPPGRLKWDHQASAWDWSNADDFRSIDPEFFTAFVEPPDREHIWVIPAPYVWVNHYKFEKGWLYLCRSSPAWRYSTCEPHQKPFGYADSGYATLIYVSNFPKFQPPTQSSDPKDWCYQITGKEPTE